MNILVTGSNGQLGCSLRHILGEGSTKACISRGKDNWYFSDITKREGFPVYFLDITDPEEVSRVVRDLEIDVIVNCAAYTDVEKAESEEALAQKINGWAAGILAEISEEAGCLLIHISTDYIFGEGHNTPIAEDAAPSPLSAYGRSKLEGEKKIRENCRMHIILRTGWLYSEYGRNFLKTMLSLTAEKPEVKVVYDQVGTPTYAGDLSRIIIRMVEDYSGDKLSAEGTYNFSDEGVCSWYDFAREAATLAGHLDCKITPCRSSDYPQKAVRPSYSVLDKSRLKDSLGISLPHWTESLKHCLKKD